MALVSFENKQKERFTNTLTFYEEFVDAFPKSKFLKQAVKIYDGANVGLEKAVKFEQEQKELKAKEQEKLAKEKESAKKTENSVK